MEKNKKQYCLCKSLFLLAVFFLSVTTHAVEQLLEEDLRAVLVQSQEEIEEIIKKQTSGETKILKFDRFLVWVQEVHGTSYIFKKRLDGVSPHESLGFIFSARHNIQRYDQAKKVQEYIEKKNLQYIKVPVIRKVRFKTVKNQAEDDFNTGIVEEFIPHPDALSQNIGGFTREAVTSEALEELLQIAAELNLTDLHPGNFKWDASNTSIWLHDLEIVNLYQKEKHEKCIKETWVFRPFRFYLNWLSEKTQKRLAVIPVMNQFNQRGLYPNDSLYLKSLFLLFKNSFKMEFAQLAPIVIPFMLIKKSSSDSYKLEQKISDVLNKVKNKFKKTSKDSHEIDNTLEELVRESLQEVFPGEERTFIVNSFCEIYTLQESLRQEITAQKDEEEFTKYEEKLIKLENSLKETLTSNLFTKTYNWFFKIFNKK